MENQQLVEYQGKRYLLLNEKNGFVTICNGIMNTLVKMLSQFEKKMLNSYNQIKRFMKKIIILLSIILANISAMQASVITGTCGSGLTWSLNTKDSTLTIPAHVI